MLTNEIINLLDIDELRNLVCHQRELIDRLYEELYIKDRELDALVDTYNNCRNGAHCHENQTWQKQKLDKKKDELFDKYRDKISHNIFTCDCDSEVVK